MSPPSLDFDFGSKLEQLASQGTFVESAVLVDEAATNALSQVGGAGTLLSMGACSVTELKAVSKDVASVTNALGLEWYTQPVDPGQPLILVFMIGSYLWDALDFITTVVENAGSISNKEGNRIFAWATVKIFCGVPEMMHGLHEKGALNYHAIAMKLQAQWKVKCQVQIDHLPMLIQTAPILDTWTKNGTFANLEVFTMADPVSQCVFPYTVSKLALAAKQSETSLDRLAGAGGLADKILKFKHIEDVEAATMVGVSDKLMVKTLAHTLSWMSHHLQLDFTESAFAIGYTSKLVGNVALAAMQQLPFVESTKASMIVLDRVLDLSTPMYETGCLLSRALFAFGPQVLMPSASALPQMTDTVASLPNWLDLFRAFNVSGFPSDISKQPEIAKELLHENPSKGLHNLGCLLVLQLNKAGVTETFPSFETWTSETLLILLNWIMRELSISQLRRAHIFPTLQSIIIVSCALVTYNDKLVAGSSMAKLQDQLCLSDDTSHFFVLADLLETASSGSSNISFVDGILLFTRIYSLLGISIESDWSSHREGIVKVESALVQLAFRADTLELNKLGIFPKQLIADIMAIQNAGESVNPNLMTSVEQQLLDIIQEVSHRLLELSRARSRLIDRDIHSNTTPVLPSSSVHKANSTTKSLLSHILYSLYHDCCEIPELNPVGASALAQVASVGINFLKSGFGALGMKGSNNAKELYPWATYPVLVLFIIGGITVEEIREVQGTLDLLHRSGVQIPNRVILGSTTIATEVTMVSHLLDGSFVSLDRPDTISTR